MFYSKDHTFSICAYKESPYLQECIDSLRRQTAPSNIIMITSSPNEYISDIAKKNNIPLFINEGEKGISNDWNFAIAKAKTKMVTVTHQDDLYCKNYVWDLLKYANRAVNPIIAFTDYGELRNGEVVTNNRLLNVKRLMLLPLKPRIFWKSKWMRRRILSFGSPICCPSACYFKAETGDAPFQQGYQSDEDWQCWEKLSRRNGSFVYISKVGMLHRIHEDSETTRIIGDNNRSKEDFDMYCKFWPKPIARLLEHFYNKSESSNQL